MKAAFADVNKLNKLEAVGLSKKICKFAEESGELMQIICRYIGMKANKMSNEEMRDELLGEIADVVQNSFCIASEFDISLEELERNNSLETIFKMAKNGTEGKNCKLEELGCKFYIKSGQLAESAYYAVEGGDKGAWKPMVNFRLYDVFHTIFQISQKLGIKFEEIEPKILEKDKKWLLRIDKKLVAKQVK